ncbi:MAG TPA: hypothetical protein DDZ51_30310 [Planctomycetaceae bacterium]|nr:hypothetical protein [Planctomycetaceae bacterium]
MMPKLGLGLLLIAVTGSSICEQTALAQFPNWKAQPVRPRIDVIPPLGNHLPLSYRARLNRPSYLGGRIAYTIEPTSQEAMAWQKAQERGYYANHAPRMETHYLYPKPWEVLGIAPRPKREDDSKTGFSPPERLPLMPLDNETNPAIERLDAPPRTSDAASEPVNAAEALIPRATNGSRLQFNPPAALELAPAIDLPSNLPVE